MAKGFEKHRQRREAITSLGRPLARRSGSRCELCESSGVPLAPAELPPLPEEPELEHMLFLCEPCTRELDSRKVIDALHLRVLEKTVWSSVAPVQVLAVRLLRRLAANHEAWATELLENLYLDPEIEEWAGQEA